jgi:hypothetical protein
MATDYSKVSLGFAEFVAQLIHETFDAILDSQNYQIDKYLGLEKALNTSIAEFKIKYLSDEELNTFIIDELGFEIKANLILKNEQVLVLNAILLQQESNEITKNKLSAIQYNLIYNFLLEKLVTEKKSKIRMFVERPELARLFVDSGEIKAKLNMFFLNENIAETKSPISKKLSADVSIKEQLATNEKLNFEVKKIDFSKTQSLGIYSDVKVQEILDKETGTKIILIDKESLKNKEIDFNIPTSRIIAQPINSSSTTSISSEVTIKFRSI